MKLRTPSGVPRCPGSPASPASVTFQAAGRLARAKRFVPACAPQPPRRDTSIMLKKILVPAFAFASLLSVSARAQDPAARPPWMAACEGDVKKSCESDAKAGNDVRPCLANH